MKKRFIKFYEEYTLTKKLSTGNPPPPTFFDDNGDGGDSDDDEDDYKNFPYYKDLVQVFIEDEHSRYLREVWHDEAFLKGIEIKDTEFYNFCKKLMNDYRLNYRFFKKYLNEIVSQAVTDYNKWAENFKNAKKRDEEFDDIMNTKEETIGDTTFVYKLEYPDKALVNKFVARFNESEEEAKKPLLYILKCKIDGFPEPNDETEPEEWEKYVKEIYNPRFDSVIVPWAEKNGYRLWSY